jgi:transcriptional regulator with XRE-family HTH domain
MFNPDPIHATMASADGPVGQPEDDIPDSERMHAIELQCVREYLGLTLEALAAYLNVSDRTVRHWEAGKYQIPDGVRLAVEALETATIDVIQQLVNELTKLPILERIVDVPRTDEQYRNLSRDTPLLTARWYRHVVMRAAAEVPGVQFRESRHPSTSS